MNGKITLYRYMVSSIFRKINIVSIEDIAFKISFRESVTFHIVLIKVFFHQCLLKFKAFNQDNECKLFLLCIQKTGYFVVVSNDVFKWRFRKKRNLSIPGKIDLPG